MEIPHQMHVTGKDAWERIQQRTGAGSGGRKVSQLNEENRAGPDKILRCRRWMALR